MLFDFDEHLFSTRPYSTMIRKTVKSSMRAARKQTTNPEHNVTMFDDTKKYITFSPHLLRDPPREQRTKEIIFLGQGEASKSTRVQQMRLLYTSGYSDDERGAWRVVVHEHIFSTLSQVMQILGKDMVIAYTVNVCLLHSFQVWTVLPACPSTKAPAR
ncbi:hypothetical protein DPSP01_010111 [Paraphaeosphaeria sporulosa]